MTFVKHNNPNDPLHVQVLWAAMSLRGLGEKVNRDLFDLALKEVRDQAVEAERKQ